MDDLLIVFPEIHIPNGAIEDFKKENNGRKTLIYVSGVKPLFSVSTKIV